MSFSEKEKAMYRRFTLEWEAKGSDCQWKLESGAARFRRETQPGIIYVAENEINGRRWVGQTVQDLETRINGHLISSRTAYKQHPFYAALHSGNPFTWSIVDYVPAFLLDIKEEEWQIRLNSLYPNGYNISLGAYKWSDARRKRHMVGQLFRRDRKTPLFIRTRY